jgi:hypothetical protein
MQFLYDVVNKIDESGSSIQYYKKLDEAITLITNSILRTMFEFPYFED